jgi:endonuclease YncB( thermonuclease family)
VSLSVPAETLTGRVVGVHDGDSLTVWAEGSDPVKVRLAGIDAPELKQPYGQQAKQALSALAFGREVQIESAGPDRYGRTLGTVYVGTVNVNAALVEQGAAWVYRRYPHPAEWEVLEAQAQAAERGLWVLQPDQRCPPWDWRRNSCGG